MGLSAAGHVSAGEDLLDSAVREVTRSSDLLCGRRAPPHRYAARVVRRNRGTYLDNELHEIFIVSVRSMCGARSAAGRSRSGLVVTIEDSANGYAARCDARRARREYACFSLPSHHFFSATGLMSCAADVVDLQR